MFWRDRDKTTLCVSPGASVTVLLLKVALGAGPTPAPCVTTATRVRFPEKPLTLVKVIVEVDGAPGDVATEEARASTAKSFGALTIIEADTEWDNCRFVAVMLSR